MLSERATRALNRGTTSGVLGLAVAGFAMSYDALHSLALTNGVPATLAWMWPLVVDGFIVSPACPSCAPSPMAVARATRGCWC